VGVGAENDEDRRDIQDKNQAGDWEMAVSTLKPTGDWFGSGGGRWQVSESITKME